MLRSSPFAFGMFDLLEGLPIDHQYDRSPAVPRPGRPVLLRIRADPVYRRVEVVASETTGPVPPERLEVEGVVHPARRSGSGWEAILPGRPDGTVVHYLVRVVDGEGRVHYADGRRPPGAATVFAHRVTSRRPPDWARRAVVYQVLVDRFAAAAAPVGEPDAEGWAGGSLWGVEQAVPYLSDLGVTTVWLSPVFRCHSYHGYDAVDLMTVDDRFGGDRALDALVETAHGAGLRVVLDLVPNHVSDRHPWFREALAGGPRRAWFTFRSDGSYDSFFGNPGMPKLDLDHPGARAAMIEVALHWLEAGVDGYRIDHVLGPSESFFAALAVVVGDRHPDAWLFGEATGTPQVVRRYGGLLDGATDFPLAYALREWMAGHLPSQDLVAVEEEGPAVLPHEAFTWVRFLDNHDMDRAGRVWGEDPGRLAAGIGALVSLPGVPCVLYGTEQGLVQRVGSGTGGLEAVRVPMRFGPVSEAIRHELRWRRDEAPDSSLPLVWEGATGPDRARWAWGERTMALQRTPPGFERR